MHTLLGLDDGIASGNLNWADVFFLVGTILAVLSALCQVPHRADSSPPPWLGWGGTLLALAVGCAAFGLFLL
jgi:protein-S-isoprenylcysteine O-methyltransferase Ste14